MKDTVLDLRGRLYRVEQQIKDYVKQASKAPSMQIAMAVECRIVGLEFRRKSIGAKLLKADHEAKQLQKQFNRKPYLKRR
jgi:hypothetical protein